MAGSFSFYPFFSTRALSRASHMWMDAWFSVTANPIQWKTVQTPYWDFTNEEGEVASVVWWGFLRTQVVHAVRILRELRGGLVFKTENKNIRNEVDLLAGPLHLPANSFCFSFCLCKKSFRTGGRSEHKRGANNRNKILVFRELRICDSRCFSSFGDVYGLSL